MRELVRPSFDGYTLPGSTYVLRARPDGKMDAQITHLRPRGAPPPPGLIAAETQISTYRMEEVWAETRMAKARQDAEALIRRLDRHIDPRIMNDAATAEVLRSNWTADGTSFTASSTENVIAMGPSFPGSGAALETITTASDATAGFWSVGKVIRCFNAIALTSAATPGTVTLNWRLNSHTGNSVGGASAANSMAASQSAIINQSALWLICRTLGTAGTVEGESNYNFVLSTTQTTTTTDQINQGHNIAIDTTANNIIASTVLFSLTTATAATRYFILEVLN